MTKINFTQEHQWRLRELAMILLFDAIKIKGLMGTELNVYQLLNETSINSLQNLLASLKKEISKISELDMWSLTEYQQNKLKDLQKQYEFINLCIGYKKYLAEKEANNEQVKQLKATLKELQESTKTPQQRIDELTAQINALTDETASVSPVPVPPAPPSTEPAK